MAKVFRHIVQAGGLAAVLLELDGGQARAQDALLSGLAVDNASRLRMNSPVVSLPPDRPHLGPVGIDLGGNCGVAWNDNVELAESQRQSDVILSSHEFTE